MYTLFVLLHLFAALVLILVVLLQSGKAGDLASAFGGAGSQTAFGTRSAADFLTRATWGAAIVFIITSMALSIVSSQGVTSVMDDIPVAQEPATPAATPAPVPGEATPPASGESSGETATPDQPADAGDQKPPEGPPDQSSQGQ